MGFIVRTFVVWLKLGEFLLFSEGEISDNGRGIELPLAGEDTEPFEMRSGCT